MALRYTRNCYRIADGFRHVESLEIEGERVALELGGYKRGDRGDFLELLNRWNRAAIGPQIGHNGFIYVYAAEVTSD